jgi:hypothetical protein
MGCQHSENPVESPFLLLDKVYDALQPPMGNDLNGTCQLGQLIDVGYEQHVWNGKHLRTAYREGPSHWRIPVASPFDNNHDVWVRGDDQPRILQSAHALLHSFFNTSNNINSTWTTHRIPYHTADRYVPVYTLDDMTTNYCTILILCNDYMIHFN